MPLFLRDLPVGSRIIDGEEAAPHSIPWQAEIGFYRQRWIHSCGGTILNKHHILTAGQCAKCENCNLGQPSHAVVKEHNIRDDSDGQNRIKIYEWNVHENYNPYIFRYDFALVSLMLPITFDDKAVPACLPNSAKMSRKDFLVQKSLKTSGWGLLSIDGSQSDVLMQLNVTGISNIDCWKTPGLEDWIYHEMICAVGAERPNQTFCIGDTGGPLTYKDEYGVTTVVGVVSWLLERDEKRCIPSVPFVFARVSSVLNWIKKNIGNYVEQCSSRIMVVMQYEFMIYLKKLVC